MQQQFGAALIPATEAVQEKMDLIHVGEVGVQPHLEACPHTLLFAAARNFWP